MLLERKFFSDLLENNSEIYEVNLMLKKSSHYIWVNCYLMKRVFLYSKSLFHFNLPTSLSEGLWQM